MTIQPNLMERPEVSVIMAVKNGEATLASSLDSLLYQTLSSWELIVINDGSTDGTAKILEKYQKLDPHRIQVVYQENAGLTKSLNRAIQLTRGKYLARLDADDLNTPGRFEDQLKVLKRDQYDLVVSRAFKEGEIVPGTFVYLNSSARYLQFDNIFVHGSFFGKREIFVQLGYDEQFRFAQDYDFIIRFLKAGFKLGYIYKPLYILGTGPNQISIQKADQQKELSKKISLLHNKSLLLRFYWSLPLFSLSRRVMKLVFGVIHLEPSRIGKVFY